MGLKMGAGSSTAGAGELQVISIIASSAPGLSPLTRGTHMNVGSDRVFTRFIPAGAGNSQCWTISRIHNRFGLSPLARGTQPGEIWIHRDDRFIPAGAGNTLNGGEKPHKR